MEATRGEPHHIFMRDGSERRDDLFGLAKIRDSSGALVSTVNVNSVGGDGVYRGQYTFADSGQYFISLDFFFDGAYSVPTDHIGESYSVRVTDIETNLLRVLGLLHENAVVDQQVFNSDNNLLSARIRVYDSKTNATLATSTGLLFIYSVQATYVDGEITSYRILRDQ